MLLAYYATGILEAGRMTGSEQRRRKEKLAESLRERREGLGLTRKELADRAGLSYPYVSQLETGDREPSMDALGKLAAGLGIDPAELVTGMTERGPAQDSELRPASAPREAPGSRWVRNPGFAA